MFCQASVTITEQTQIGEARRLANRIAVDHGFNSSECGNAKIVATELATNLARYAQGGEVLLRSFTDDGGSGIELLAIDRGPGMANLAQCLNDGFSTGGTPGNGLGAVQRLSSEFDIFSRLGSGTVVFARVPGGSVPHKPLSDFTWGAVSRPMAYEELCGDTWRITSRGGEVSLMVADGLGHGPLAAQAADVAAHAFVDANGEPIGQFFTIADRRMRGTRGAAIAVARLNIEQGIMSYVGVGNISGFVHLQSATRQGLVSHNGTVGAEMRKVQQFEYSYPANALLIMHSDGLQQRWSFDSYPGLANRHPAIVASVLYRDFTRGRDDVTVCVIRNCATVAA